LFGKPFDTGLAGHDIVENDDIKMLAIEFGGRFDRIGGLLDLSAVRLQRSDQEIPHPGFVIDNQDGSMLQPWSEFRFTALRPAEDTGGSAGLSSAHFAPPNFLFYWANLAAFEEISQDSATKFI
jgi:hypothetical protein